MTKSKTLAPLEAWDAFGDGSWFTILREDGSRLTGASIEGSADDMHRLAEAIRERDSFAERRCAIRFCKDHFEMWSPRNHASDTYPHVTIAEADTLADYIERHVPRGNA